MKSQALTPEQARVLLAQLKAKKETSPNQDLISGYENFTKEIEDRKVGHRTSDKLKNVAYGLPTGAVSVLDTPAALVNAGLWGAEKLGNLAGSNYKTPTVPYVFGDSAREITNAFVGAPRTEDEAIARGIGEVGGGFYDITKNASKVGSALNSITPSGRAVKNLKNNIGNDIELALENKLKANELGLNITPAEATGNPLLAMEQGSRGISNKGAQALYEYNKGQVFKQKEVINDLYDNLTPVSKNYSEDVRSVSKSIIDGKLSKLQEKAQPYYEKASAQIIENDKFAGLLDKNPYVKKVLGDVLSDPLYQSELRDYSPNSIKVLDEVKKRIDDKISVALRNGENNDVRLLRNTKAELIKELDSVSPDYKQARSIYNEELPDVKKVKDSAIGKIANMSDEQLKTVTKTIFNPEVKDLGRIKLYRDEIYKESPEVWNGLVRNELERKLSKGEATGSAFYKNVLQNETTYKQMQIAMANNPEALRKLNIVKSTFSNLIGQPKAKTAATLAKSSLNDSRNSIKSALNTVENMIGGVYDRAAIDLITGNEWDKPLKALEKIKDKDLKSYQMINILNNAQKIDNEKQGQNNKQISPDEARELLRQMKDRKSIRN